LRLGGIVAKASGTTKCDLGASNLVLCAWCRVGFKFETYNYRTGA
jgi:hypothetical protein